MHGLYYIACIMQNPLEPDHVKVKHLLDQLLAEVQKGYAGFPNADPVIGLSVGLVGALCQLYDVEKVRSAIVMIANDPRFWKMQQDSKAGKLII